ncbi:hypothetical protein [Hymenobacter glaciei]|uniref:hypothetical protein n=1 Tax=Hymenobacter glaciei TaxID=877209 RepID=UPI0031E70669
MQPVVAGKPASSFDGINYSVAPAEATLVSSHIGEASGKEGIAALPAARAEPFAASTLPVEAAAPQAAPAVVPSAAAPSSAAVPAHAPLPGTGVVHAATPTLANDVASALFTGAEKPIRRIVIFYRDGSFADYQPE